MKRTFSRPMKRVVVKLGSSQIADRQFKPKIRQLSALAKQVKALRGQGVEVTFVSSGAIVLGMGLLEENQRPTDLAALQARAAIGQAALMRLWAQVLKKVGLKCAQVLLTWDDFDNHNRFLNARHTMEAILKEGVVPIINENDTTSTEEIKFGDNDKLSALVASLIHADLLVILSDVQGLYDTNQKVFEQVKDITSEIEGVAGETQNIHIARGGMKAKLEAVKIATHARITCVITAGDIKGVLVRILEGEKIGTLFMEREGKLLTGDDQHEFIRSHFKNG
ncbi:MAG: glutamate 5-kinase [Candidatus Omnitrophica bacterium]|nr:glutamate 5-kinase [Candidatus Omnitrophota bacterium]